MLCAVHTPPPTSRVIYKNDGVCLDTIEYVFYGVPRYSKGTGLTQRRIDK
jgi:hypothetical protein